MSTYLDVPAERARRIGLAVLLGLVLTLAVAGWVRERRAAAWRVDLPVHPSALAAPEQTRSRLLRWRSWSYPIDEAVAPTMAWYAEVLAGQGWQAAGPARTLSNGRVQRWQRGAMVLDLRVEPAEEHSPGHVRAVLTDLRAARQP